MWLSDPGAPLNSYPLLKILLRAGLQRPHASSTKIILSSHDFQATADDAALDATIREMFEAGADIAKVATTAQDISDALRILRLPAKAQGKAGSAHKLCLQLLLWTADACSCISTTFPAAIGLDACPLKWVPRHWTWTGAVNYTSRHRLASMALAW